MDKDNYTKKEYLAMIDVAMGGRVAEEMIFGKENVTTGAHNDIMTATNVAKRMVTLFGMSDKVIIIFFISNSDFNYIIIKYFKYFRLDQSLIQKKS